MPKISIIVPVYKVEDYLHQCITSIIAQTFTDWELILVDDGSPDKSGMICDEYAQKDSRIRVIHKPNGGVSSARNTGIDNAIGKWITFIDADDYILPNFIMGLYKPIRDGNNVDFVHGGCCNVKKGEFVSVNQHYEDYIGDNSGYLFNKIRGLTISKLFKLNKINVWGNGRPLRFDEKMKIAEDMAFTMDYLLSVNKYAFVNEIGYCYRVDNMASATKNTKDISYIEELYSFKHLFNSTTEYMKIKKISHEDSRLRLQQRGNHLASTCLLLYRNRLPKEERIGHLKNDFNKNEWETLRYAKLPLIKDMLFYLLVKKKIRLFDSITSLLYSFYK